MTPATVGQRRNNLVPDIYCFRQSLDPAFLFAPIWRQKFIQVHLLWIDGLYHDILPGHYPPQYFPVLAHQPRVGFRATFLWAWSMHHPPGDQCGDWCLEYRQ